MINLAETEDMPEFANEGEKSILELEKECARLQLETLLSGEADTNNAFIAINAGAGGTEAQDWAAILASMYTRWAESK